MQNNPRRYNMFSFNPLWKVLIDKKMTREDLRTALGFSPSTMAKMSKGEYVSMEVIHKICHRLNLQPNEIFEYIPE
jgi:putative transcriptional regulator